MDQKIEDALAKLYRQSTFSVGEVLKTLTEVSIQMMRYRDQFLEQGQRRKARDIHRTLARYYRGAATLAPTKKKGLFLILSDYWRRGGESFWEPSPLGPKKISPSKSTEEDAIISTTEHEEVKKIDLRSGEETDAAREEKISIEREEEGTVSIEFDKTSGKMDANVYVNVTEPVLQV